MIAAGSPLRGLSGADCLGRAGGTPTVGSRWTSGVGTALVGVGSGPTLAVASGRGAGASVDLAGAGGSPGGAVPLLTALVSLRPLLSACVTLRTTGGTLPTFWDAPEPGAAQRAGAREAGVEDPIAGGQVRSV